MKLSLDFFMNVASFRLISIEKNLNAFECENHSRVPRQLAAYFLSAKTAIGPLLTKSESSNNFETSDSDSDQAFSGHRRPRRPGVSNNFFITICVFPSLNSWFLSQIFAHQARMAWKKTRKYEMTITDGNEGQKYPGKRGRRRPEEP